MTTRRVPPDTIVLEVRGEQAAAAAGGSLCLVARTRVVLLPLTITPEFADALGPGVGPDG